MLERQERKVDGLNKRPHHPVCLQGRPPGLLEALFGAGALHGGHTAKEHTNHDGSEQALVTGNTGKSLDSGVSEADVARQESKPGGCNGAKDALDPGLV